MTLWGWAARGQKPEAKSPKTKNKKNRKQDKNYKTMKKLILTTAIVLTMGVGAFAQGLLGRGEDFDDGGRGTRLTTPGVVDTHNYGNDVNGNGETSPLGSGIAVLMGLGAAYVVAKKRKEE